jgi:hypothetical protein
MSDECSDNPPKARPISPDESADTDIDVSQLDYLLSLTPAERVRRHDQALELVLALRQAGIKYYGFDPRSIT